MPLIPLVLCITHLEDPPSNDRDSVRDIQRDSAHTEDGLDGDRASPVEATHQDGDSDNEPDGEDGGFGVGVDLAEEASVRETAVTTTVMQRELNEQTRPFPDATRMKCAPESVESPSIRLSSSLHREECYHAYKRPDNESTRLAHPENHDLEESVAARAGKVLERTGTEDQDDVEDPTDHLELRAS